MSGERELIITSAVIVQPGDKVLLIVPAATPYDELWDLKTRLDEWAPGTDWLLVAGVESVYQRLGVAEVPSALSRESNQPSTERTAP